jgi:hypothetical protein
MTEEIAVIAVIAGIGCGYAGPAMGDFDDVGRTHNGSKGNRVFR